MHRRNRGRFLGCATLKPTRTGPGAGPVPEISVENRQLFLANSARCAEYARSDGTPHRPPWARCRRSLPIWQSDSSRYGFEFKRADAPRLTPSMRSALDDLKLRVARRRLPGERHLPPRRSRTYRVLELVLDRDPAALTLLPDLRESPATGLSLPSLQARTGRAGLLVRAFLPPRARAAAARRSAPRSSRCPYESRRAQAARS